MGGMGITVPFGPTDADLVTLGFTVTTEVDEVVPQVLLTVQVIIVLPEDTPDKTPLVSTVAIEVELDVHVPFSAESVRFKGACLFDIYRPKGQVVAGMSEGEKSLAVRLTLSSEEGTLTEAEIESL